MQILVTGAAGFLGQRLIRKLLELGSLTDAAGQLRTLEKIIAVDTVLPPNITDSRVQAMQGDFRDLAVLEQIVNANTASIFHLAAIVSGQAEEDLDLGMSVNFDASRAMFDHIRLLGSKAKLVMTSSVAVFGGELPALVKDSHVWAPQSSYGTQKAMADLLLADYSRRGLIDGRSLRLPTIVVRPGKPNRAASSFASGIIREPVNGINAVCPVSPQTLLWLLSPEQAIRSLIHGHELPAASLARGRVINLPGLSVSVETMIESLRRVAGEEAAQRVLFERDPAVERIVNSWPGELAAQYGRSLGFEADKNFDAIVRQFVEENTAAPTA